MRVGRWTWAGALAAALGIIVAGRLLGGTARRHQFEGRCQDCHVGMPHLGAPFEEVVLKEPVDQLCSRCHRMNPDASHPVGVKPHLPIPLQRYLDADGRLTCVTCHDVHKEEHAVGAEELTGLLRGHVRGEAFCATCHREELLGAGWRHQFSVSYAHASGRLTQAADGAPLDSFSVECLSCHDGTISRRGAMDVRAGTFQHGQIGPSHPVGVDYPRGAAASAYTPAEALPGSIPLFNGRVGCLSCHSPYSRRPALLVMEMTGSALCLACHRK
ncbi:MAG: hypothetical protein HY352_01135 [Candidatus Omnitrophica bacterium]|nr:hypothetical protein [Candidatus Omnitrophota bacterium]